MAFLAVAELRSVTGLDADRVSNSWGIAGGDATSDSSRELVMDQVAAFYQHQDIANILSNDVDRTAGGLTVKLYNLDGNLSGSPHGSPIDVGTYTIPAGMNNAALPQECAIAITLYGVGREEAPVEQSAGTVRPKQRRTGRIYLGPLGSNTVADVSGPARVNPTHITQIGIHLDTLQTSLVAGAAGESLAVWSRVDATMRAVTSVAIDNAFDTQRRRGVKPSTRTIIPVGP